MIGKLDKNVTVQEIDTRLDEATRQHNEAEIRLVDLTLAMLAVTARTAYGAGARYLRMSPTDQDFSGALSVQGVRAGFGYLVADGGDDFMDVATGVLNLGTEDQWTLFTADVKFGDEEPGDVYLDIDLIVAEDSV